MASLDFLDQFLGSQNDKQNPRVRSVEDELSDFLEAQRKKVAEDLRTKEAERQAKAEKEFRPYRTTQEMQTDLAKNMGLSLARGFLDIPASIGSWMVNHGIANMGLAGGLLPMGSDPMKGWNELTKKSDEKTAEIKSRVFSPTTQANLRATGSVISAIGEKTKTPGLDLFGKGVANAPDLMMMGPDMIGQMAGSIPTGAGAYGTAAEFVGVASAKSLAGRISKHMAASTLATAAQSYLIATRDGESSFMRIVKDVGLNAAFEVVGLPGIRASWMNEAGDKAAGIISHVAQKAGVPNEIAELKITQIRAGAGAQEPKLAQTIVDLGKKDKTIGDSPLGFQAKKSLAEYWNSVVPDQVNHRPTLGKNYGISFDIMVNGKKINPEPVRIRSAADAPNYFTSQVDKVARQITELSTQGHSVRLNNIQYAMEGSYVRFLTRLRGEKAQYGKMDSRALTAYEQNLGTAARRGTYAESATKPAPGTKVLIDEPDKPRRVAIVEQDEPPDMVNLYRWEQEPGKGVPEWVEGDPRYQASKRAAGSWYTDKLENIEFYKKDAGGKGRAIKISLTKAEAEKYRVKNNPEALRYSADPDTEYFVPPGPRSRQRSVQTPAGEARPKVTLTDEIPVGENEFDLKQSKGQPKITLTDPNQPVVQRARPNEIKTKDPVTGKISFTPTRNVRIWLHEKNVPTRFTPHSDGEPRYGMIDLNAKEAWFEEIDSRETPSFFRSSEFTGIDRDGGSSNGPRVFVGEGGALTLSLTKGERMTSWSGVKTDLGPLDLIEASRPLYPYQYKRPSERYAHQNPIGSPVQENRVSTRLEAGKKIKEGKYEMNPVTEVQSYDVGPGAGSYSVHRLETENIYRHKEGTAEGQEVIPREERVKHVLVLPAYPEPKKKTFRAGFEARMQRTVDVQWHPYARGEKYETAIPITKYEQTFPSPEQEIVEKIAQPITAAARTDRAASFPEQRYTGPSTRYRTGTAYSEEQRIGRDASRLTKDPTYGMGHTFGRTEDEIPMRYAIGKGVFIDDPALIDARDSAKILLQKNMDPKTPVRVVVSDTVHAEAHEAPHEWTLEELANFEPGLYDLPLLQVGAHRRGFAAIPKGEGVVLKSLDGVGERTFATRTEAANFLGKQKIHELGPNMDTELEKQLQMGWLGDFDAAVDGGDFVPREAQTVALNALVNNQRAGVKIWTVAEEENAALRKRVEQTAIDLRETEKKTADYVATTESTEPRTRAPLSALRGLQDVEKGKKRVKASGRIVQEIARNEGLSKSLTEMETKLGVRPGTFKVLDLEQTQGNKGQYMIYNAEQVDKLRRTMGHDIERLLKIGVGNEKDFLRGLMKRKGGIDILTAPDPESALIYAHYKNGYMKDKMEAGTLMKDDITARTFRSYPPEVKAMLLKSKQPPMVQQMDAAMQAQGQPPVAASLGMQSLIDPEANRPDLELKDVVQMPPELDFQGSDVHAPMPPIMETPLSNPDLPENVVWRGGLMRNLLKTRPLLFQQWERETGLPFWQVFNKLNAAEIKVANTFRPMEDELGSMVKKVRYKGDRDNIQLLFEARMGGRAAEAAQLAKKMRKEHVAIADRLEKSWVDFGDKGGFGLTKDDFAQFFGRDVEGLRNAQGDYHAYTATQASPSKIMQLLRRPMAKMTSPLRITDRETDFYSLGTRLARVMSYEQHFIPVHTVEMGALQAKVETSNMPQDLFENFQGYADAMMHAPDSSFIGASRTAKLAMEKANTIYKRMTGKDLGFRMSDDEHVDVLGGLARTNYAANLGLNTASWLQQWLQIFSTGAPFLGMKNTKTGLKHAVKWLNGDEALAKKMEAFGITGKSSVNSPFGLMDEFMSKRGAVGANFISRAKAKFDDWGSRPFQVGDDFGRVAAFMGKHDMVVEHGQQYMDGKITWPQFIHNSKLDLQDYEAGPLTKQVKTLLDAGQLGAAADVAGNHMQQLSMFMYSRGNNSRLTDGALGRFLGMYSKYPVGLGNMLVHLATVGEKKMTVNKANAFATMLALNAGMKVAMDVVFNADASRWVTWNSVVYRGGPYKELIDNLLTLADGTLKGTVDKDPIARNLKYRVGREILRQVVPGTAGATHFLKAAQRLYEGDLQGAGRELTGLPEKNKRRQIPF